MEILDISQPIKKSMVVWPGDPIVNNHLVSEIANGDEANVTFIQMSAHTGTHIDAPRHFIKNGKTVEELDLQFLIGPAEVIQIPTQYNVINQDALVEMNRATWPLRILFRTRNSDLQLMDTSKFNEKFTALEPDAAKFLFEKGVKLIGIDYLSIAPYENGFDTHFELLSKEIIILEGLNLSRIQPGYYQLIALPILLSGADGAPARVLLIAE